MGTAISKETLGLSKGGVLVSYLIKNIKKTQNKYLGLIITSPFFKYEFWIFKGGGNYY